MKDEKNLEAVIEVVFVVCSGCNDHGTCNYNVIRGVSENNDNFRYATCDCQPYWDGEWKYHVKITGLESAVA